MKQLYAFITLALAAFACNLPAMAASSPILRAEVQTLSNIVTIGDFYENAGAYADTPLFRSPDMGTSGDVPAETVAKRARAAGLIAAGTNGLDKVTVHRRAETYTRKDIEAMARKALARQDATLSADDVDVTLTQSPSVIHANPGVSEPVHVEQVLWSRPNGRFTLKVNVAGLNGSRGLTITGYAQEMVEVGALLQPMRRGAILKKRDLTTVRLPRSTVPARALTDLDQVVGLAAHNNLRANAPLARSDFERPIIIARKEKVTITYELPGMKLTTRGEAMDDGAKGDVIDIKNPRSKRIVQATVVGRGHVRVEANIPMVASLNKRAQQ